MRHLRPSRQLRTAGRRAVCRPARKPVRQPGTHCRTTRRQVVAGPDPRHDQVRPLPALRRRVPSRTGRRCSGDQRNQARHFRRPEGRAVAEGFELRDLRAMRAGLPDGRARRARRDRQGDRLPLRSRDRHGGAVRPRHPRRLRRGIRSAAGRQRARSDYRRLPQARLRYRARHELCRRRGNHGRGHRASQPAGQGPSPNLHLVLPGLDQLRRTTLPGGPAAPVERPSRHSSASAPSPRAICPNAWGSTPDAFVSCRSCRASPRKTKSCGRN